MARILHISDLHIGARLGRYSQNADIRRCLDHICAYAKAEAIDALLLAGDIFDTYNPSGESEEIYYEFLDSLSSSGIKIFIIAGNHDNHERLNAPAAFLKRHSAYIMTGVSDGRGEAIEIKIGGEKIAFILLPFITDAQLIDIAGYSDEKEAAAAYREKFATTVLNAAEKADAATKILITHAFCKNSTPCGSERPVQRGNSLLVEAGLFAGAFSYCAFGHLHRYQKVCENAFYSGSIIPVSIDEAAYEKKMILIETGKGAGVKTEAIGLPRFSSYKNISGAFVDVYDSVRKLQSAFITIIFNEAITLLDQDNLLKAARENDVKIVSLGFDLSSKTAVNENSFADFQSLKMPELFKRYLASLGEEAEDELIGKFGEIYSKIQQERRL